MFPIVLQAVVEGCTALVHLAFRFSNSPSPVLPSLSSKTDPVAYDMITALLFCFGFVPILSLLHPKSTPQTAVSYAYGLISYNLIISVVLLQLLINGKEGIGPRVDGVPPSAGNIVGIGLHLMFASGQIVWLRKTYSDLEKKKE